METEKADARQRLDAYAFLAGQAVVVDVLAHAADAVAAHFRLAAVGVEHTHTEIRHGGIGGRANEDQAVASDAEMTVADAPGQFPGMGDGLLQSLHIDVIVACGLHFGKSHECLPVMNAPPGPAVRRSEQAGFPRRSAVPFLSRRVPQGRKPFSHPGDATHLHQSGNSRCFLLFSLSTGMQVLS